MALTDAAGVGAGNGDRCAAGITAGLAGVSCPFVR